MKKIYIAGPMSIGNLMENVRHGIDAGDKVIKMKHCAIIPHLSIFHNMIHPNSWQTWLDMDLELIKVCDAVYRIEGESKGADIEVEFAKKYNKEVFFNFAIPYIAFVSKIER